MITHGKLHHYLPENAFDEGIFCEIIVVLQRRLSMSVFDHATDVVCGRNNP